MHRRLAPALSLIAFLAVAPAARAQRAPDTATLDRGDGISKFGVDLGFTSLDGEPYDGGLRLEPYGQYVLDFGLGFYAALPISMSFGDEDDAALGDQDDTALGNLDVGLLYVIDSPSLSWILRGGVALPTADDYRDGILTNYAAVWPRLTDWALAEPDAVYVRFALSPLIHVNNLFLRADIGFDLGIDDNDSGEELLRLNLAGGVDLGLVSLALELVNLGTLDDFDGDGERFLHTLAFSARFMTGYLEPFLGIGVPLDDYARDNARLFVSGGIQVAFH